jgi:hypothetical protein
MQGDFPPNVVELIQRQLSQFGRVGATKIYRAPALAAAIAAVVGTVSNPINIRFREPGTVIALYGQEQAGTAPKFATTEVRIQVGGSEDIFTDGETGTFVPMLALFGGAQNWFPMWRRAEPGVDWLISYRNQDGGNTAIPSLLLAFVADADLARAMPPRRG